jgi:hypothetical protein
MLHEFLTVNHDELVARCVAKVAMRPIPPPTSAELTHGIPLFLGQITATLRMEAIFDMNGSRKVSGVSSPGRSPTTTEIDQGAGKLSVRNRPGKGCVFTIHLPLQLLEDRRG